MSVDGTDFPIQEPSPFSKKWYSYKFNGAGIRYEVGILIQTGWIVWLNGPFPAGCYNDRQIAEDTLHLALAPGEMYLGDRVYYGKKTARQYAVTNHTRFARSDREYDRSLCRARHECINSRFKKFEILKREFRHHCIQKHKLVTYAVANILQVQMEWSGKSLTFQVQYYQPTISDREIYRPDKDDKNDIP